ncbi:transposase [Leisingera sp.]|uniref:transposase n=1 Tax=Leisingera sp. TaxID=1879318 RepID=UPI003A93E802
MFEGLAPAGLPVIFIDTRHAKAFLKAQVNKTDRKDSRGIAQMMRVTFCSAVDDPARFSSSKKVGPWTGLTPSRNQSGERDVSGGITKAADANLRRALC